MSSFPFGDKSISTIKRETLVSRHIKILEACLEVLK